MMSLDELMQLEWAHPWWALLALQPLLMALLLRLRRNQVLHYADAHLLAWVVRGSLGIGHGIWGRLINLCAWILLGCALAGPRLPLAGGHEQQVAQRHEMDIMVLLDLSPSMLAVDVSPQRLQRAKLELLDLLPRLHGERLGLLVFSASAAQIMPLSRDYAAMRYYLGIANPGLIDAPGTAIASALELAIHKMPLEKSPHRAVLLLTDAETSALSGPAGSALREAANKLRQAGIRLYILAVGTAAGSTIPVANGGTLVEEGVEVLSRMDVDGFAELAGITGGKLAVVEDGEGDWRQLYDKGLLPLPGGKQPAESVLAWQELYASFLLPALLLLLIVHFSPDWNKLRAKLMPVLAVICLAGIYTSPDSHAAEELRDDTEVRAYAAYRANNYSLAQSLYAELHGYSPRMGEGAVAYRRKDYQYAIRQFSSALLDARDAQQRERALYNLGNSYFMAGGFRAAADAFLGVLKYAPENQDARANLALSAGRLASIGKTAKNSQGILGRRGRETGGKLGEDASDKSLAMSDDDGSKGKSLASGRELAEDGSARLSSNEKKSPNNHSLLQHDNDMAHRAALKKLELATDTPEPLLKALVKIEAAKEYVPQAEMPPW